ncbi:MAG: CobW family GTP-binding protein [Pikeienuella sp.]
MSVPVLLATGFLGAGKTTFINGLLLDNHGRRIAAIVNDFGSINIDAALLDSASDTVIGLRNGCICCSLQGDLLRTLKQVLAGAPDLIVIEASGVADPQGVVDALLDPVLWRAVSLDMVVCLVDAQDLTDNPDRAHDPLWRAQIAAADVVQLSKVDGVAEDALAGLVLRLSAMGKRRVFGADGDVGSLAALLALAGDRKPGDGRAPVAAEGRFASAEWRCEGVVPMAAFQQAIGALAPTLLRAKGFMSFRETPGEQFIFQLVGQRASLAPRPEPATGCELVLIGRKDQFDPQATLAMLDDLKDASPL